VAKAALVSRWKEDYLTLVALRRFGGLAATLLAPLSCFLLLHLHRDREVALLTRTVRVQLAQFLGPDGRVGFLGGGHWLELVCTWQEVSTRLVGTELVLARPLAVLLGPGLFCNLRVDDRVLSVEAELVDGGENTLYVLFTAHLVFDRQLVVRVD